MVDLGRRLSPFEVFKGELDRIVCRHTDGDATNGAEIVRECHFQLAELIMDMSWLAERHRRPSHHSKAAAYLLGQASDDSWTIVSVVFPAGASTPIHDHLIWGLVGVWQGQEDESRYERLDDGSRSGFARLRHLGTAINGSGSISHVIPPAQEIHSIHNPLDALSCSIHVYGGHLDQMRRHRYDPASDAVYDYHAAYTKTGSA